MRMQFTPRSFLNKLLLIPACGLAAVVLAPQPARATLWTGAANDQNWATAGNWNSNYDGGSTPPADGNKIWLDSNAAPANHPIFTAAQGNLSVLEIHMYGNTGSHLDQTGGSLTTGFFGMATDSGSSATFNLSDGTFASTGELQVGVSAAGTLNQTGGTLNSSSYLVVGRNSGSVGVFSLSGGTVNGATTSGFTVIGSFAGSNGTLNVSGDGVLNSPREMRVGEGGTGTLNQTGGTVSVSGVTHVGWGGNNASTQNGTLTVSGGTFTSEGDLVLGYAGGSTAQANVTVDGGTLNVGTTTKRWLIVSRYDTVSSTLTVSSGNLNLNAGTDLRFSIGGNSGTNTVTLNGGAITSYSGNQTGDGAGVVDLAQGSGVANNTFNLDGGTLAIRAVITNNDTATATFNFNGGTLKATGDDANFVNLGGANQRANVLEGGAVMDSNGYNVTVVQPLLHGGTAATDGGLVKSGTGTLTLSNTNTYTGPTMVAAGVLAVNGSVTSDVTVATDATLQGIGAVGSVTGTSTVYGRVAPGNSIGTLTVNGSMAISGTFDVEYDDTLTQPIDLLNVSGTLDITSAAVDFADISSGSIGLSGMAYVFATYGTLSGSQFASVVDLPSGYTIDYAYGGNNIALVPEPTAALLAGLGLLGLLRRRRR